MELFAGCVHGRIEPFFQLDFEVRILVSGSILRVVSDPMEEAAVEDSVNLIGVLLGLEAL